ncbi:MAG TPA: hypothetical protein VK421_19975 [Pyrinomonadaceae bacterium]|nr:hypothetical protein [Pyrinomonadaceae bacterium]
MYAVIGLYGELDKAQHAVNEMVKAGTPRQEIKVTTHEFVSMPQVTGPEGDGHIFGGLNEKYPEGDGASYTNEILKGGTVITLEVPSEGTAKLAEAVMRLCGAAHVERREGRHGRS